MAGTKSSMRADFCVYLRRPCVLFPVLASNSIKHVFLCAPRWRRPAAPRAATEACIWLSPAANPFMISRKSSAAEDVALLSGVMVGDERAFLSLYERFSGPVFSLLMRMLQNQQDAEEVLQIAFLQIWKKAGTYDSQRCSVFTWLVLIARSKAIDRMRQRQRHMRTVEEVTREEAPPGEGVRDEGNSEVHQNDRHAVIRAALEHIPADQRQAIEMAFFGGMSQTEIAESLAEPLGTVKARIRRGMLRLRDTLARRL